MNLYYVCKMQNNKKNFAFIILNFINVTKNYFVSKKLNCSFFL